LIEGFHFYETQPAGIGGYFLANLYADIESLRLYAGIQSNNRTCLSEPVRLV
jgi:hypothetical protein